MAHFRQFEVPILKGLLWVEHCLAVCCLIWSLLWTFEEWYNHWKAWNDRQPTIRVKGVAQKTSVSVIGDQVLKKDLIEVLEILT